MTCREGFNVVFMAVCCACTLFVGQSSEPRCRTISCCLSGCHATHSEYQGFMAGAKDQHGVLWWVKVLALVYFFEIVLRPWVNRAKGEGGQKKDKKLSRKFVKYESKQVYSEAIFGWLWLAALPPLFLFLLPYLVFACGNPNLACWCNRVCMWHSNEFFASLPASLPADCSTTNIWWSRISFFFLSSVFPGTESREGYLNLFKRLRNQNDKRRLARVARTAVYLLER